MFRSDIPGAGLNANGESLFTPMETGIKNNEKQENLANFLNGTQNVSSWYLSITQRREPKISAVSPPGDFVNSF